MGGSGGKGHLMLGYKIINVYPFPSARKYILQFGLMAPTINMPGSTGMYPFRYLYPDLVLLAGSL